VALLRLDKPDTSITDYLFVPDSTVPHLWHDMRRQTRDQCGEHQLMLAVLEEAQLQYRRRSGLTRAALAELVEWFLNDDLDYVFSFRSICAAMQFDPTYIRRGLGL
jgi:hypothetical protein